MFSENIQILSRKIAQYFPQSYTDVVPFSEGGMGWVYLATYQEQKVCIKIPSVLMQHKVPELMMRFQVERDMLFSLNHPRIIKGVEAGEIEYEGAVLPYFSMEYCPKGSLRDKLNTLGKLERHVALNITLEIASALDHFHKTNCIYRDLKPENIFFDATDNPKLGDFGTIKHPDIFLTRRGDVIGSFYYCAPEQLLNQALDQSVDIFALGLILFEMVTGRKIGNQVIESWKKQQALMEIESDSFLWHLCSSMLAERKHRLNSMSQVIERIYDSHGSQKKIKTLVYYMTDWWYGKSLQRTSEYRSEIVSALNNIMDLVEVYSIDDVVVEMDRKLKSFPIYLIANEIPGFVAGLALDLNIKLAKVLVLMKNKGWIYYLIRHLVIHSYRDDTGVLLMHMFLETPHDKKLKNEIISVFRQIWSHEQIQNIEILLDCNSSWNESLLFKGKENYPIFPLLLDKIKKSKDNVTIELCLDILSSIHQAYECTAFIFVDQFFSPVAKIREICSKTLGKIFVYKDDVLPYLLSGLADSVAEVRLACALSLGKKSTNISTISALITGLYDNDYKVRDACVISLGKIELRLPEIIENLVEKLKDTNDIVRISAAKSLLKLKWKPNNNDEKLWFFVATKNLEKLLHYPNKMYEIVTFLLNNDNFKIRQACLSLIIKSKSQKYKYIPMLIEGLVNKKCKLYRQACANALVELKWHPNNSENYAWLLIESKQWNGIELFGESSLPAIYQNLKDSDEETRLKLLEKISLIKKIDRKTWYLLLEGFKEESLELVEAYADCLVSIEPVCTSDIYNILCQVDLVNDNAKIFWSKVLSNLSSSILVEFVPVLENASLEVQIIYLEVLNKVEVVEAIPFLLKGLQHENKNYQIACVYAFEKISDKQILISEVLNILKNSSSELKIACLDIVSRTKNDNILVMDSLIENLDQKNQDIILAVENTLITLGNKAIFTILEKVKENKNPKITKQLVDIIRKIGSICVPEVALGLEDENNNFRLACAYLLPFIVKNGLDACVAGRYLFKAIEDADSHFSDACAEVLLKISPLIDNLSVFVESLAHENRKIRKLCKKIVIKRGHSATSLLIKGFLNGSSNLSYRCAEILEQIGSKALNTLMNKVSMKIDFEKIYTDTMGRYQVDLSEKISLEDDDSTTKGKLDKLATSRLKQTSSLNKILPSSTEPAKIVEPSSKTLKNESSPMSIRKGKKDNSLGELTKENFYTDATQNKKEVQERKK